jgi:hypothetical protein
MVTPYEIDEISTEHNDVVVSIDADLLVQVAACLAAYPDKMPRSQEVQSLGRDLFYSKLVLKGQSDQIPGDLQDTFLSFLDTAE